MFERFTDRARRVVVLAQEEARLLGHDHIGTEDLLLGLVAEDEGVAARALEGLGIDIQTARAAVEKIVGPGPGSPGGHIPFTPQAKRTLESSMREALALGHNHIGTEYILLGLLRSERESSSAAGRVIVELGLDLERVLDQVHSLLGGVHVPAGEGPACARCGSALADALTTTEVQVPAHDGAMPIAVLFVRCAECGAVAGLLPGGG
jgi:ATP-dependent Clp protease ATP-binding subunit ClpC